MFKTVLGARRIGGGSVFGGKRNFVGSFEKNKRKLIVCWNLNCLGRVEKSFW